MDGYGCNPAAEAAAEMGIALNAKGGDGELSSGGAERAVTVANRDEYVRLVVCHRLGYDAVVPELDAFAEGVRDIVPLPVLAAVGSAQWQRIVAGAPSPVCLASLRLATQYDGYDENSPQVLWLWAALEQMDDQWRRRFLAFATGSGAELGK